MDYTNPDHEFLDTRNDYKTAEEIEIRRRIELMQLVDAWKDGASVWQVLRDIGYIMDMWFRNSFDVAGKKIPTVSEYIEELREFSLEHSFALPKEKGLSEQAEEGQRKLAESVNEEQTRLRPYIKPEYFEDGRQAEIKAAIEAFSLHITENDEMTSFAIARSIVETICQPSKKELGVYNPIQNLIGLINETETTQKATESKVKISGTLEPEPEERVIARVAPFIKKMKKRVKALETEPKLIKAIHIDAVGSGMIKPLHFNIDYLPEETQQSSEKDHDEEYWDDEDKGFSPYDQDYVKEDIYGTTTARITTYSVSFEPYSPEQLKALYREVRGAVIMIADIMPAFGIPTDFSSEPYKRPFTKFGKHNGYKRGPHWAKRMENTYVTMSDGKVSVDTYLDLDDTLNLYYLLEHRMELNAQIAQTVHNAIHAEARSGLQSKYDMEGDYDIGNEKPDDQLGNLAYKPVNQVFLSAAEDAMSLYSAGYIDQATFLKQVIALAGQSLTGRMADPYGAFPAYQLLLSNQSGEQNPLTPEIALRERTTALLRALSGIDPDSTQPVTAALFGQAARLNVGVRDKLRNAHLESTRERRRDFDSRYFNSGYRDKKNLKETFDKEDEERQKALTLSDIVSGFAKRHPDRSAEAQKNAVSNRSNLVLRDSPVEACLDRTYSGTPYTSRMPYSPWPRKVIPANLRRFVETPENPYRSAPQLLLEFNDIKLG